MPIKIFFCYSRRDEALLDKLKAHLRPLQRQGLIDLWHDRDISAGDDWEQAITQQLNEADIILLLVSPDFMESDYCYSKEMQRALERHANGECVVIPIILRPVYWHGEPLGKLQALPTDGKPITGPEWHDQDSAFYDVVMGMYKVIQEITPLVNARKFVLFKTLRGHQDSVYSVNISKGDKILISGSEDHTIKIWDLLTGKEPQTLIGHKTGVYCTAISKDGKILVSGGEDHTIKIWDLLTGKELQTLIGHQGIVWCVTISEDGKTVISGSRDHTIKIWDLLTGKELRTLIGHRNVVRSVAISEDGKTLVSGSRDQTVKIWDLLTGRELRTLIGHQKAVRSVAISKDGKILISGSEDHMIKIWDLLTGKELRTLAGHKRTVRCVAISEDGLIIVSCSYDQTISIWKA